MGAKTERTYVAIDLKSFYASVECVQRGLDPLTTRLVVADETRTDKTICLAVSPALKIYGIPGRARLFEVKQRLREVKRSNPSAETDFIIAPPQMGKYLEVSGQVYGVYIRYVSPDDIHVYSVDEVFIDATEYLRLYSLDAHDFARMLVREVLKETGVTATAGIGPNMYLAKVAMDIEAKHSEADADGVRVASLTEMQYRRKYWEHVPLTDFWRIGKGTAARLASVGLYTLGDVARCSLVNEEVLYRLFGVGAELLIDHAWGWEPCTIADIKKYRPQSGSLSSGQVLKEPYSFEKAEVIVKEMTDSLVLSMVDKGLLTDQMVLHVGYDTSSAGANGESVSDWYGVPKPAHGSVNLPRPTSSTKIIMEAVTGLFRRIVDPSPMVRRILVIASHISYEDEADGVQLSLFDDAPEDNSRERRRQEAILSIRKKFGSNAILRGTNFEEGATAIERHNQIGGHRK